MREIRYLPTFSVLKRHYHTDSTNVHLESAAKSGNGNVSLNNTLPYPTDL